MKRIQSNLARAAWIALPAALASACARGEDGPPHSPAGEVPRSKEDETLLCIGARHFLPDGLWCEASYQVELEDGRLYRELELEVGNAPPDLACDLVLDGFALGAESTDDEGELELELSEEDGHPFPPGFPAPKVGSTLRIGELMTLRFEELEEVADLEAVIAGPGPLSGDVDFEVERLGSSTLREFQVEVEGGPVDTVHPVMLDRVHVGDLTIDIRGRGSLEFSSKRPAPFPPSFPELRPGSQVQLGELFRVELRDTLAGSDR